MENAEYLLEDLDLQQREVATTFSSPVCVLAGAGTGKTRAITYRIAYAISKGIYRSDNVLALTFTTKAAFEMKERLSSLGVPNVTAKTFHSAALSQLKEIWPEVMKYDLPRVLENKSNVIAIVFNALNLSLNPDVMRDVIAEIEWAKVSLISIEDYADTVLSMNRKLPHNKTAYEIQRIFQCYEKTKVEMGVIDFEDILVLLIGIFKIYPDVLNEIRKRYRYFIVDEYQDVSLLQQVLLDLWVKDSNNLCVVGDACQTIYSFAGASPSFLLDFTTRYANSKKIILNKNYRCGADIIKLANNIATNITYEGNKVDSIALQVMKDSDLPVEYMDCFSKQHEAELVSLKVEELLKKGVDSKNIAILYRTNSQSQSFEEYLSAKGIKFYLKNDNNFFEKREILYALKSIKDIAKSTPNEDTMTIVENVIRSLGWSETPSDFTGEAKEKWDNLNILRNIAVNQKDTFYKILDFYNYLYYMMKEKIQVEKDAVVLSSLHACKGLEWDYVFLVGIQEGLLPIYLAKNNIQIEDEQRLLYVGVTRARKKLYISKFLDSKNNKDNTCRFLRDYWKNSILEKIDVQKNISKDFYDTNTENTIKLYEELKAWRKKVANEYKMDSYKVITDKALQSISIAKPNRIFTLGIIKGVSKVVVKKYGRDILKIIKKYI